MAEEERAVEPEAPAEPAPPEPRQLTIDLDAEADDGPEEKAAPAEPDKKTRRQQAREVRAQRDQYERDLALLRNEVAELRGRVSVPSPAANGGAQAGQDQVAPQIASIQTQQDALLTAIQAPGQPQSNVERLAAAWRELEDRKFELKLERHQAKNKQSAQPEGKDEDRFIAMTLAAEFPQVFGSEAMRLRAQAEMTELLERGKPRGLATGREACQRVLGRAGLGQRPPAPTDIERSRYASIPSRAGVAGNGAGNQYQPNKFEMSLAKGFTAHRHDLTDEERWRLWAKATGSMPKAG